MAVKPYQEYLDVRVRDEKTFYQNITEDVQNAITRSNFQAGIVLIQTLHTTTGLTNGKDEDEKIAPAGFLIQEDEPCLTEDLKFALDFGAKKLLSFIPKIASGRRTRLLDFIPKDWADMFLEWTLSLIKPIQGFKHDDFETRITHMGPNERKNAEAHIKAAMIRESLVWAFSSGRLDLGQWQSIIFWDFDPVGRKKRKLSIILIGE